MTESKFEAGPAVVAKALDIENRGQDSLSNQSTNVGVHFSPPHETDVSRQLDAVALEEIVATSLTQMQQMLATFGHLMKQRRLIQPTEVDIETAVATGSMREIPTNFQERFGQAQDCTPPSLEAGFDKILSQVKPWDLSNFDLVQDQDPDPHNIVRQFKSNFSWGATLDGSQAGALNDVKDLEFVFIAQMTSQYLSSMGVSIDKAFSLMACCCLAAANGDTRMGNVLKICYHNEILEQPTPISRADLIDHVLIVLCCSQCMNRVFPSQFISSYRVIHSSSIFKGNSLEEVLGIDLVAVLGMLFELEDSLRAKIIPEEKAIGSTLELQDLDIKSLASIGGLRSKWTSIIGDHMKLDLQERSLSIAWIGMKSNDAGLISWYSGLVEALPPTFAGRENGTLNSTHSTLDLSDLNLELERSYNFLFSTDKSSRKVTQYYDNLPPPDSIIWLASDTSATAKRMHLDAFSGPRGDYCVSDPVEDAVQNGTPVSYSEFPLFEARLRHLRHYMDSTKPRGLRQLWKDKRDSLNYYTFWGVIIFGALTLVLTLLSLAVGIAQTVASFKSLALATPAATPAAAAPA